MRTTFVIGIGAGAALLSVGLASCLRSTQFRCSDDTGCLHGATQGRCEATGYCSFPDTRCESGQRFGESGPGAGQCVDPEPEIDAGPDAPPPDAAIDAYVHDARECFGAGAYQLCFAMMPPMGTVDLSGTLDTVTDTRCIAMPSDWGTAGQQDACLITGSSITVSAALTVTGARPLVLLGETVTIAALLDVASHRGATTGPAANATQCAAFPTTPVARSDGGGGGAGGSFMTKGGDGGRGQNSAATGGTAAVADATAPALLRGGCAGQIGGTGTQASGAVGAGGGAIYIAASVFSMTNTGVINASGAGATGGGTYSGGSGAGAGGMIVIYANQLGSTTGGRLLANGGGGASGGDSGDNGANGSDPNPASITTAAAGGPNAGTGSTGGNGFAGTNQATNGQGSQNNRAGGGGGGGGGYIQINQALPGVTASPTVTVVP
jgi:hypothetical protein